MVTIKWTTDWWENGSETILLNTHKLGRAVFTFNINNNNNNNNNSNYNNNNNNNNNELTVAFPRSGSSSTDLRLN